MAAFAFSHSDNFIKMFMADIHPSNAITAAALTFFCFKKPNIKGLY
jgi:hypothetical protein